jgi:hypothetical protein
MRIYSHKRSFSPQDKYQTAWTPFDRIKSVLLSSECKVQHVSCELCNTLKLRAVYETVIVLEDACKISIFVCRQRHQLISATGLFRMRDHATNIVIDPEAEIISNAKQQTQHVVVDLKVQLKSFRTSVITFIVSQGRMYQFPNSFKQETKQRKY